MIIESKSNKDYKLIKSLANKKYRRQYKLYLTEGLRAAREALKYPDQVEKVYISEDFTDRDILKGFDYQVFSQRLFKDLSKTNSPQGIMLSLKIKTKDIRQLGPGQYILTDGLQDPGNLGGIIRSIDAFNFDGLIVGPGTVDSYNDKVVRSSMGSIHRVSLYELDSLERLRAIKSKIYSADLKEKSQSVYDFDFKSDMIIAIGNEGAGVSKEVDQLVEGSIHIPMLGPTDSLNANVSASIIMYEAARQRWKY